MSSRNARIARRARHAKKCEGSGAPKGAEPLQPPASARFDRRACARRDRASAGRALSLEERAAFRHSAFGDFGPRDRTSWDVAADSSPTPARSFRRARLSQSSHRRQSLVVGTDGDPRPPGLAVTNRRRGRRTLPAYRSVTAETLPRWGRLYEFNPILSICQELPYLMEIPSVCSLFVLQRFHVDIDRN